MKSEIDCQAQIGFYISRNLYYIGKFGLVTQYNQEKKMLEKRFLVIFNFYFRVFVCV